MKAGQLRHRIDLQSPVSTQDDTGQPSTSWLSTAFLWGDVRYLSGLSAIKAGADTSTSKVSIRVRHGSFNAGQRVLHDGKTYAIDAVLPDGKKQYIDLVCHAQS